MLATLQPTVVGFHMARLRCSIIQNICEVCQQTNLCFVIFGKPDWSHCALSHHHALPYLTLKQLSNGQSATKDDNSVLDCDASFLHL